jgi:hypothetical protein
MPAASNCAGDEAAFQCSDVLRRDLRYVDLGQQGLAERGQHAQLPQR